MLQFANEYGWPVNIKKLITRQIKVLPKDARTVAYFTSQKISGVLYCTDENPRHYSAEYYFNWSFIGTESIEWNYESADCLVQALKDQYFIRESQNIVIA
jgi:hypothetical protein